MANEFIIRKGFKSLQDSELTGSLNLSGNIVADGTVEASFASGTSTAISGAFDSVSSSLSDRIADQESFSSSLDNTFATDADLNLVSSSVDSLNAASSSYLQNTTDTLTGDLTVTGTITAQEFHTEFVSASITYESGSHKFGDTYDDVHEFTGSVNITNSNGGVTGSYTLGAGGFTISGDDADFNLNITSGSSIASLTEIRFQVDGGTMGRLYMHKDTKNMYLGPTNFPTSSLYLQDGTGTVMSITGSSVGIGTTEPETELDVRTSSQQAIYAYTDGGYNALEFTSDGGATTGSLLAYNNTVKLGNASNVGGFLNGIVIDSNGNLGIGTASPSSILNVKSAGSNIDEISLTHSGNTVKIASLGQESSHGSLILRNNSGTTKIRLSATGSNASYFNAGYVGIGTTSPVSKLHVVGSGENGGILFNNSSAQEHRLYSTTNSQFNAIGSSTPIWHWVQYTGVGVTPNYKMTLSNTGLGIGTNDPSTKLHVVGEILTTANLRLSQGQSITWNNGDNYISGISGYHLQFTTYDGSSAQQEVLRLTGGAPASGGGRVGIGTSSPLGKLHINTGTTGITQDIANQPSGTITFSNNSGGTAVPTITGKSSNNVGLYLSAATPDSPAASMDMLFDVRETDNTDFATLTSTAYRFARYGNSLLEVKRNGNVGIGTTTPIAPLTVKTTGGIDTGITLTDGSSHRGKIYYDGSQSLNIAGTSGPGGADTATLSFLTGAGTQSTRMVITRDGNVGIGTTLPIYKFHVNSGTQAARFTAGDGGYAAVTFDGDAGNTIGSLTTHNGLVYLGSINSGGTGANGEIRIEPFGGNVMTLDSGGNVGIGNQDPLHKLSVTGDSYFSEQLRVDQPVVSWSDSGTKHYTHLATFSGYGSAASALIINTNIPGHNQSGNGNMFSFRIVGYAYGTLGLIDMMVGCYAGENNYYSAYWTGTCQTNWVDNVYVYTNSSGKVAFQIGETTDTLSAEIAITDFVQGFGNVNTSYADSWSCQAVTTLPTQTQKTTLAYKAIAPDIYEDVTFHNSVGIGTTSITKRLEVLAASNTDGIRIQGNAANASLTIQNNGTGGNAWDISSTGAGHGYGNGNLIFGVGFSPKVTFKSDGYILNGGHAANDGVSPTLNGWGLASNGTGTAVCNFSNTNEMVVLNQRDGSGTTQFEFRNGNVERGRIEWTTSGTTYNTNSDYRLKENVTNLTGSLASINQLEPKTFNFISDPDEPKIGFIAHEVQDVVPQAVSGIKDAVREDGTPKYQGLDHSMLVPLLVGAIKEQQTIIEDLKTRIETLEG